LLKLEDPITGQIYNTILVIVDKLIKWGYFIAYTEEISVEDITRIYIKEVFIRYRALIKIILDRDLRFILVF
jgi:small neutral amino acid transporter SnatA (MarC family)